MSLKPFQRLVGAAAIGGRASQGAKPPFRRVLFCQARESLATPGGAKRSQFSFAPLVSKKKADYRFRYTMWVLSFYTKHFLLVSPLFLLAEEAQKKKLSKKKSAYERFRRVRAATNAPRVGSAVAF